MNVFDEIDKITRASANNGGNAGCIPLIFLGCFGLCVIGFVISVETTTIKDILSPGFGLGGWCIIGAAVCLFLAMLTSGRL